MDDGPPPLADDREIIRLMCAQNEDGAYLLLKRYGAQVKRSLANRYQGILQEQEIDQALNDAAFNAWRFAVRFQNEKGSLGGWFLRIAQNMAKNILRDKDDGRVGPLDFDPAFEFDEAVPLSDEGRKVLDALEQAIEQLPPLQNAIINADLAADGVADAKRLAQAYDTSVGSILVSRYKARRRLAEILRRTLPETHRGLS